MTDDRPVVLVVDDEDVTAEAHARRLGGEYDTSVATSGREALERIDRTVDVVLLDRRMPDMTGDEVLDAIRDRGLDPRVAMVTALEPDFDILEMGFDAYVTKPADSGELAGVVERLLRRAEHDDRLRRLITLEEKRVTLAVEKSREELENNEEYAALEREIERLREDLSQTLAEFDQRDFRAAFYDIDRQRA